jgi:hypothetical protein
VVRRHSLLQIDIRKLLPRPRIRTTHRYRPARSNEENGKSRQTGQWFFSGLLMGPRLESSNIRAAVPQNGPSDRPHGANLPIQGGAYLNVFGLAT